MLSAYGGKHLCFSLILFLFLFPYISNSQNLLPVDTSKVKQESVVIRNEESSGASDETMTKSPVGALWRTFLLPGLGQIYVENYWKAPIFIGAAGTFVYFIIWNNSKFLQYKQEYDDLKASEPDNTTDLDMLNRQKEYYRDNRDKSYFFLGITYIVAAIDAYVGAYLFDFNVDDDLSVRLSPYYTNHPGISASFRFK